MLNADGLIEGGLVHDSFDVGEINTAARITKDSLYFGEITDQSQLRADATAHLIWNRDQAVLTAQFAWTRPVSRLLIAADRQVPYEISAAFEGPVNALTVESRRHRTFVSFCRTVVDNGDVRFDPIGINWENADTATQQAAKAKLVAEHIDRIVSGKIARYAPIPPASSAPSATL